ncbi:MAG: ABC transporter permease [Chloroflexota bacterium]
MTQYLIRRILWLVPVLFVISLVTFIIMHATPGGPFDLDPTKTSEQIVKRLEESFGLNKPLFLNTASFQETLAQSRNWLEAIPQLFDAQFENYLGSLLRGDLGPSYRFRGRQVNEIIFQPLAGRPIWESRIGTTAVLGILALLYALALGLPLGVLAALRQNSWVDHLCLFIATVGYGIPNFVLSIFLIIILAVWLDLVKVIELDYWSRWQPWVLPTLVLGTPTGAFLTRLTRASMLEVMRMDYVRTARAKGLMERLVVLRHMLRNALIPVATYVGPALAGLVTGSFIIESQFLVTGIGRLFVESIFRRDYTIIMALTLLYALLVALANLGVDLVYVLLDPRIKLGKRGG